MKVAVVQPYFFPYIGYIQLLNEVDTFVIFDDVNFVTKGWIKRNRVLNNGQITYFGVPVEKASQNKKINQLSVKHNDVAMAKLLRQLQQSYGQAANFSSTFSLIEKCLYCEEVNLSKYLTYQLQQLCQHLNINTQFVYSSEINQHEQFNSAQERIIALTKELGGNEYVNLPGGVSLYSEEEFAKQHVKLSFIKPNLLPYSQLNTNEFVPALSIIDIMMNTDARILL